MYSLYILYLVCLFFVKFAVLSAVQAEKPFIEGNGHLEAKVAVLCDSQDRYQYNCQYQYIDEDGKWTYDYKTQKNDKNYQIDNYKMGDKTYAHNPKLLDYILKFCKMMYPDRKISNIVETAHFIEIENWCYIDSDKPCKRKEWMKPYRCLEGPFQSDALLVPDNCVFKHKHNQSQCRPFEYWNQTSLFSCEKYQMSLHSFAMLLPCGLSLFSGVEYVCCVRTGKPLVAEQNKVLNYVPDIVAGEDYFTELNHSAGATKNNDFPTNKRYITVGNNNNGQNEDNDDDDNDESDDDGTSDIYRSNEFSHASSSSTLSYSTVAAITATLTTPNKSSALPFSSTPYMINFDPFNEHRSYKEAKKNLRQVYRKKVTNVMKDWSDLEERYQEMKLKDPRIAEEFKQRMTIKFQQTVESLEEQQKAERQQLVVLHQQRISAHINQQKKESINCFTNSLNENPPSTFTVEKCLRKLLQSLYKDRHHILTQYRHLLTVNPEQAAREKVIILDHLYDVDRMMNQSFQMLQRYPAMSKVIRLSLSDYITELKNNDKSKLIAAQLLDKYKWEPDSLKEDDFNWSIPEKQRTAFEYGSNDGTQANQMHSWPTETTHYSLFKEASTVSALPYFDGTAVIVEHMQPVAAHSSHNNLKQREPMYIIKNEQLVRESSRNVYFTLSFAVFTVLSVFTIGILVINSRKNKTLRNRGFVEVDQIFSPEERHVANMQINGYENPTYKYFDMKE